MGVGFRSDLQLLHINKHSLFPGRDSKGTPVEYKSRVLPLNQLSQNLLKCHVVGAKPVSIGCHPAKISFLCGLRNVLGENKLFQAVFVVLKFHHFLVRTVVAMTGNYVCCPLKTDFTGHEK